MAAKWPLSELSVFVVFFLSLVVFFFFVDLDVFFGGSSGQEAAFFLHDDVAWSAQEPKTILIFT